MSHFGYSEARSHSGRRPCWNVSIRIGFSRCQRDRQYVLTRMHRISRGQSGNRGSGPTMSAGAQASAETPRTPARRSGTKGRYRFRTARSGRDRGLSACNRSPAGPPAYLFPSTLETRHIVLEVGIEIEVDQKGYPVPMPGCDLRSAKEVFRQVDAVCASTISAQTGMHWCERELSRSHRRRVHPNSQSQSRPFKAVSSSRFGSAPHSCNKQRPNPAHFDSLFECIMLLSW